MEGALAQSSIAAATRAANSVAALEDSTVSLHSERASERDGKPLGAGLSEEHIAIDGLNPLDCPG